MKYLVGVIGLIWKLYIALIFSLTAILMYPVIIPFLTSSKQKKRAFHLFVFWSRLFRFFTFYFLRVRQNTPLPEGPFIILSNHSSYLDIFLMYSVFPRHPFLFLGKSELLRYPLIGTYFRKYNIPVYRDSKIKAARALIHTKEALREGWNIAIFPEGGIPNHEHPQLGPFKAGAFQLAKDMHIPIVPMTFLNNHILFSDPTILFGPACPGISKVIVHPVVPVETIDKLELKELRDLCHEIIKKPLPELRK